MFFCLDFYFIVYFDKVYVVLYIGDLQIVFWYQYMFVVVYCDDFDVIDELVEDKLVVGVLFIQLLLKFVQFFILDFFWIEYQVVLKYVFVYDEFVFRVGLQLLFELGGDKNFFFCVCFCFNIV